MKLSKRDQDIDNKAMKNLVLVRFGVFRQISPVNSSIFDVMMQKNKIKQWCHFNIETLGRISTRSSQIYPFFNEAASTKACRSLPPTRGYCKREKKRKRAALVVRSGGFRWRCDSWKVLVMVGDFTSRHIWWRSSGKGSSSGDSASALPIITSSEQAAVRE